MKKTVVKVSAMLMSAALAASGLPFEVSAESQDTLSETVCISSEKIPFGDGAGSYASLGTDVSINGNYNYAGGAYNLGYYLDDNNAAVYMAFMELVNPSLEEFEVKLPDPITVTTTKTYIDLNETANYNAVFSACRSGVMCADFDLPELFWLDTSKVMVGAESIQYVSYNRTKRTYTYQINSLTFTPDCYDALRISDDEDEVLENIMSYKTKLESFVEEFDVQGATRYDQLMSIHDGISDLTYYDIDAPLAHSAVGALIEPGAVCEGYSKAFKLICDRIGIPCVCIFGNYDPDDKSAHMWNYVLMEDNKWYAIDTTWDDFDGQNGYDVIYKFFLKGSDTFFEEHTESPEYGLANFVFPELSETEFDPDKPIVTTTTTTAATTTTTKTTTTTAKPTTTTTKATTTTAKPTTTTTKATTTTAKPTTTTTKATTTTAKRTTTTTKATTTTAKPTTTTTTQTTTTTAKIVVTTSSTAADYLPVYLRGDLNRDGQVSVADLVYCVNHVLGKEPAGVQCDLTGDKVINAYDVVIMRKLLCDVIAKRVVF